MYKEYKSIQYYTLPTENEVNAYFLNKESNRLPSQEELEDRAKNLLEKTISEYIVYGWKLQGSVNIAIKGEWSYPTSLRTEKKITIICYSQGIYYGDCEQETNEQSRMDLEVERWLEQRKRWLEQRKRKEEEDIRKEALRKETLELQKEYEEKRTNEKRLEIILIVVVIVMFVLLRISDLLRT